MVRYTEILWKILRYRYEEIMVDIWGDSEIQVWRDIMKYS